MAPERGNRSRNKRKDVRYILIRPKSSTRMKLPARLFHPGRAGEDRQPNLSYPKRIAATLIAATGLCPGLAMVVLGLRSGKWLLVLLGGIGLWYGIGWVRVAHEGRLPGGRLRLNPWARG